MIRFLLPSAFLLLLAPVRTLAQQTYTHTLATMQGYGLTSNTPFTFPGTPNTVGGATLSFSWLACYQGGFGTTGIRVRLQTGASSYVIVHEEVGGTISCSFQARTVPVSASQLQQALVYGAGSVQGDVRITDACQPGVGCSFYNDPGLQNMTLSYTVVSANFTSPDATICPGGVVQFNDASLVSPSAYEWSFPGGVPASSTLTNPVVQYADPGQYDVMLTITDANGTSSVTRTDFVTVYDLPTAFAGVDQSFCAGGSAQLQASGGGTYQWLPATGLSNPNIANPVASPGSNTLYTVIVTSAQGCTASDAIQLSVVPAPVIVLSATDPVLCGQDTLTITASGADLYTWSPNLFISSSSGATVEVWPPSDFTWTVTGNNTIGCSGQTTVSVTVLPAPPTPVITWSDMVLNSTAGASYQWYLDGAPIDGATGQTWTPTVNGDYRVEVTDANGCGAMSAAYFFGSTGLNGVAGIGITVYPQPVVHMLFVDGVAPGTSYRLIDVQGRVVAEGVVQAAPKGIATDHLAPGMHVLVLAEGRNTVRVPIVVE